MAEAELGGWEAGGLMLRLQECRNMSLLEAAIPFASSSSADFVPCFLFGFTSLVQMAPLSLV